MTDNRNLWLTLDYKIAVLSILLWKTWNQHRVEFCRYSVLYICNNTLTHILRRRGYYTVYIHIFYLFIVHVVTFTLLKDQLMQSTTRQHTDRYTGYKYKQRAYDHIPIQTYDEACSWSVVGTKSKGRLLKMVLNRDRNMLAFYLYMTLLWNIF
jgi:hypothetical protein